MSLKSDTIACDIRMHVHLMTTDTQQTVIGLARRVVSHSLITLGVITSPSVRVVRPRPRVTIQLR